VKSKLSRSERRAIHRRLNAIASDTKVNSEWFKVNLIFNCSGLKKACLISSRW